MTTETLQTLSPIEAGRLLGFGRTSIYRLIREGEVPAVRLGRKLRVPRAALEDMLRMATHQRGMTA